MKTKITIIFFILFLFNNSLFSQSKEEVFSQIGNKYKKISSISFNFQNEEMKSFSGSLKAKKNNKYIIEASDRIIRCNGKTLWNYSLTDNKVIISDFEESYVEENSIETIFFSFLNDYEPIELKREQSSKSSSLLLVLKKKKADSKSNNEIKIWLEPKTLIPVKLQIYNNNEKSNWFVSNLKTDLNLNDSQFNFTVPKEAEVIDLR